MQTKTDLDLVGLFDGMTPEQVKETVQALQEAGERKRRELTAIPDTKAPMEFIPWVPGDGPAPYVYSARPAGHRCAWTCMWSEANVYGKPVQVNPNDWGMADPALMLPEQLEAELQDMVYTRLMEALPFSGTGTNLGIHLDIQVRLPHGVTHLVRQMIAEFRQSFNLTRSFTSPYNPPRTGGFRTVNRPGWHKE